METIMENCLTQYGLRRVHVLSDRKPERETALSLAPMAARETVEVCAWQEDGVGFWHLWAVWHARGDVVEVRHSSPSSPSSPALPPGGEGSVGVMWYVEPGERMGVAIEQAAMRYYALFERWPGVVWLERMPNGAPEEVEIGDADGAVARVRVLAGVWVPKRCVFVTEEA